MTEESAPPSKCYLCRLDIWHNAKECEEATAGGLKTKHSGRYPGMIDWRDGRHPPGSRWRES